MFRVIGMPRKLQPREYAYFSGSLLHVPSTNGPQEFDDEQERTPFEWYGRMYPLLVKTAHALRHLDHVDGRVLHNDNDETTVTDDYAVSQLHSFKRMAKAFIALNAKQNASHPASCFSKLQESNTTVFDSLTKVCNLLFVSAQQRKTIRVELCRHITNQNIWRGALEEVLNNLERDMGVVGCKSPKAFQMGRQIISCCVKFLKETGTNLNQDASPLWAQLWSSSPAKKAKSRGTEQVVELLRWADVADMFQDLTECLEKEERLATHIDKVEAMKEGLYQMKNIVAEREIGYNEARLMDSLVQRRLSMSLGHSSKCLFTLLMYYLYGSVRHIEVDACRLHGSVTSGEGVIVYVGKVLTSNDERMVRRGVKQLDRALGVIKFVWEMAKLEGALKLQGHLWCVGGDERSLNYRGNKFFLHQITLRG